MIYTLIIGTISCLSILTKQIGVAISITAMLVYYLQGRIKRIIYVLIFSSIGFSIYILIGVYYDWNLFLSLQQDVRVGHTLSGLPEIIANIFRFPTIGPKNHPFLDGTILFGWILLFSSPLWLGKADKSKLPILIFPFTYLSLLAIGQSGSGAFTFFGWYLYPLFPTLIILAAKIFYEFFTKPTFLMATLISLLVGSSTVRFLFLLVDRQYHYLWQYSIVILLILMLTLPYLKLKTAKIVMVGIFVIALLINIIIIFNLNSVYQQVAINDQSLKGFLN